MARPLVLVPSRLPDEELRFIAERLQDQAEVRVLAETQGAERRRLLERAEALLVFAWKIEEDELPLLGRVQLIQSAWAGVDRVPLDRVRASCPRAVVATTRGVNAAHVAEHAVGLYLACTRGLVWRDRSMRSGGWPQRVPAARVTGSRIAVVGYGHVGRRVARALDALDAEVWAVTRSGETDDGRPACAAADLRGRLPDLHGVVLAVPLTASTRGWVDRAFLQAMPEEGVLVNVARGPIVVEEDLYAHLLAHPRFQAGLDVWWSYPKGSASHLQRRPFHTLPNVVMTPHSAFQAPEARREMVAAAVDNIARFLRDGAVENVVPPE